MSRIFGTGLNGCKPTKFSGCPLACASSAIDSDEVVVASTASAPACRASSPRSASIALLEAWCSITASTRNVALGQVVEVGHDPHAVGIEAVQLLARLGHPRAGALGRIVRPGPEQHLVVLGGGHGQAAGDRARTGDSHSFPQDSSLVDGFTESFSTVITNSPPSAIGAFAVSDIRKREQGMPQSGREVVIVEAVRTPIGRGHKEKGYYKDTHANELLGRCYSEVIERAGIDASEVEDVVAGCVQQYGEQSWNVGRNAWLQAGLPIETPATTVDRQCGSAQQAVELRGRPDRRRRARRGDRLGRRAHGPRPDGYRLEVGRRGRHAVSAGADGALQPDPPGPVGRDDRRPVGDPALGARRARAALPPAGPSRHRGGPLRAGDPPVQGQRLHLRVRPGDPSRAPRSRRWRSSSRRSSPTARSPPVPAPRSPTAPPPCC